MADGHQSSWEPWVGPTPPCVPVSQDLLTGDLQQPNSPHHLITLHPVPMEPYPSATPGPGLGPYPPYPVPATSGTVPQWNPEGFLPRSYAPNQSLTWHPTWHSTYQDQAIGFSQTGVTVPPPLPPFRSTFYQHQGWFNPVAPSPHVITYELPGPSGSNMGDHRESTDNQDRESIATPISFRAAQSPFTPPNSPNPVAEDSSSPNFSPTTPDPVDELQISYPNDEIHVTQNNATMSYNEVRVWVPNTSEQEAALATSVTLVASQSHYQHECRMDQEVHEEMARSQRQIAERDQQIAEHDQQIAERDQRIAERDQQIAERDRENVALNRENIELNQQNAALDQENAELDQNNMERGHQIAELKQQLEERDQREVEFTQQIAELNQKMAERGQRIAELDQKVAERGQRIAELNQKMAERGQHIAELDQKMAERDQRIAELNQQRMEHDQRFMVLYRQHSILGERLNFYQ